jgi:hypothetical protein
MTCEIIGRLVALCLGYMPTEGQLVEVPRRCERRLAPIRRKAESCAAKHGIHWRIVDDR